MSFVQFLRVGAYCDEVTPVPIPNTEVKLIRVDDTRLVTARESRSVPALIKLHPEGWSFFCLFERYFPVSID